MYRSDICRNIVWRPGVPSAKNVFATWAEVVRAVATMNGEISIGLDTDAAAAVIPPGAYDLRPAGTTGPVSLVNASKAAPFGAPFVTLGPGAVTIAGLSGLNDVSVDNTSTVPVIAVAADGIFRLEERATVFQEPAAGAFWQVTAGAYSIFMSGFAAVSTPGGGTPALVRVGGTVGLVVEDAALFDTNMLTAAAGVTVLVDLPATYRTQAGAPAIVPSSMCQKGSSAILAGTGKTAAIPVFLSATGRILVTLITPVGDALTVKYAALGADRVNGAPGSFKISALVAAGGGAINGADTSTIDWEVIL